MTGVPESQQGEAACPCTGDSTCAFHLRFNAWPDDPAPQPAVPDGAVGEAATCTPGSLTRLIYCEHDGHRSQGESAHCKRRIEETAERILASDWLAERLAEARAEGAASVRARVQTMMRKAAHRVLSLHYSEPERFERETLRLAHDLSVQADGLRAALSGGDDQ